MFRPLWLLRYCLILSIFYSCGGPSDNAETIEVRTDDNAVEESSETEEWSEEISIVGQWKLENIEGDKVKEGTIEECDKNTIWNFTEEAADPLGDGTEVFVLKTTADADCEFRDFQAKWTQLSGQVFISTSKVGGVGGLSNAGLFDILEHSSEKMVLTILGTTYHFKRA
jgi:hypothetical protein